MIYDSNRYAYVVCVYMYILHLLKVQGVTTYDFANLQPCKQQTYKP